MANPRGDGADPRDVLGSARFALDGERRADSLADEATGGHDLPPAVELAAALHEVSNALTVVTGWIDRARDAVSAGGDRAVADHALGIAAARARQARVIVRRAIGADLAGDPPRADADVVADAALGLEPEARDEGVRVVASVSDEVGRVEVADATTVLQILTNLLLNAIEASPAGASVRLEARRRDADGALAFVVEDEGPGVAPVRRATLLTAGVSTRAGGAGIGLKHASSLARARGGSLRLVDSARGARFELVWPTLGAAASPGPAPDPRRALAGARILLVEDDDAVVELLDTALGARGASVMAIRAEAELAGALASGPFDAALLDASPFAGALAEALESVRRASPGARLVVISGSACAPPFLPAGLAAAWVRKPFEVAEIVASLTAFVPPLGA